MMRTALATLLFALPLTALGNLHHDDALLRRRHTNRIRSTDSVRRSGTWSLQDHYQGEDFFTWDFFNQADPTGGNVNYVSLQQAQSDGLVYVDCDNRTVLAVDANSTVPAGGSRNSVRISSPNTYNGGLMIADFAAMPIGCGTWPAFWLTSLEADWPNGGEIDIIEGVNDVGTNQITLHSAGDCALNSTPTTISNIVGRTCLSTDVSDAGCAYSVSNATSFGPSFNSAGGGVYALLWDNNGMTMYFFGRSNIPSDLTSGNPDPSTWSTPAAVFPNTICDIPSNFFGQAMVLDTTLCGNWAGDSYGQSTCPGTCSDMIANSTNFVDAKWIVNYISVYQQQ